MEELEVEEEEKEEKEEKEEEEEEEEAGGCIHTLISDVLVFSLFELVVHFIV